MMGGSIILKNISGSKVACNGKRYIISIENYNELKFIPIT